MLCIVCVANAYVCGVMTCIACRRVRLKEELKKIPIEGQLYLPTNPDTTVLGTLSSPQSLRLLFNMAA